MLLVVVAGLTWFYPEPMTTGAVWLVQNLTLIMLVLLPIDAMIWLRMYKRYRTAHPFIPVQLEPAHSEGETRE
jgi:hypothetical protein